MKKIILDTNFLLIPMQFNLDIFDEIDKICLFKYKLFIIDKTIKELENIIEKQRGKHKNAAKIALMLIKQKKLQKINTKEETDVDSLIVKHADKKDFIVATQDIYLKRRLKEKSIPLILMRQGKKLVLEGKI